MLEDYIIPRKRHRWIDIIQFVLLLIIFQSMIFLLDDTEQEELNEDIQFRVIAHSNEAVDQQQKEEVQHVLMQQIERVRETTETAAQFHSQMEEVTPSLLEQLDQLIPTRAIAFERKEAIIPPKRSGFYFQPQGAYEAYVVTIGSGRGDNWWCALFANICYPAEEQEESEEVTFFIWEWIKGWFS